MPLRGAMHPELRTATRLTFYVLSPCLVFVSLVESNIDGGETAQIFIFVRADGVDHGRAGLADRPRHAHDAAAS